MAKIKTETLRFRASPQLKARLHAQAKSEERSMSSLMMFILKKYLAEHEKDQRGKKP